MIPASDRSREELEVAYRRYETLRMFNATNLMKVHAINLRGPHFDDLIDAICERMERGERISEAIENVQSELGVTI